MLIIPTLLSHSDVDRNVDRYIAVDGVEFACRTNKFVRCPIVQDALITDGACFDFQAVAQNESEYREWLDSTLAQFEKTFKRERLDMMLSCIQHQIDIVKSRDGEYPKNYLERLQSRLLELNTSSEDY